MGLDMYLSGKRYLWSSGDHPDKKIATDVSAMFPELTPHIEFGTPGPRVNEISARAIFWRKANAIHAWFVKNVQGGVDDCGNYYADRDLLTELRDKVQRSAGRSQQGSRIASFAIGLLLRRHGF